MSVTSRAAGRLARFLFLRALDHINAGSLTVRLPGGSERRFGGTNEGPTATLVVHDDSFFMKLVRHGEIGFGEAYVDGLCSSPDMVALLSLAIVNRQPIPALDGGRITFILLELARGGRRLAPSKERVVHIVGFAVLIAMIIVISVNDIQRILGGAEPFG